MKEQLSDRSLVILTGAGISAESGIKTFRDHNGLWEDHRIEDVATPEAFARNPGLVQQFYNQRRKQLLDLELRPNQGHFALATLEQQWPGDFLLITQNVDNLHRRAGNQNLLHMHGELQSIFCVKCKHSLHWKRDLEVESVCPKCRQAGSLRPDIVWFGEMPYHMEKIEEALEDCDYFVAIGTSGVVYPAAGFVQWATKAERHEINLTETPVEGAFHRLWRGPSTVEVPKLVDYLLQSGLLH